MSLEPVSLWKSTKVPVIEAKSSCRRMIAQVYLKKKLFNKLEHATPPAPRNLSAVELKDPGPAPLGNGEPGERSRRYTDTTTDRGPLIMFWRGQPRIAKILPKP